ncbi:hypothetical protein LC612_33795, partial [Nostoc sp. CHAB 5834]|nr:hypothetical protein [Nostoc sp. CHAB 5834]
LNVTYGYINQLRNGLRDVKLISDDFTRSCAAYLNVPRMTVLVLSGRVTASDFFQSNEQMGSELSRAMAFITEDPAWGPLITAELRQSSNESKYALVRLYEKANGKVLMSNCLDPQQLLADMQSVPIGETATA